ncbi:Mg-dependent DNase [Thermanaerovibrio velox DSM 12556]|uniref:Mg-dependent DNase n=1 Tax=Thermanaerovibrio velox DSM 12556 TaxID=926567 RepID=H0UQH4_9BACT|nr:TatD family hydrolase [Thermanaerovibrio velox]EHM09728.1 Mg-dependent DNase [Thermanaerovibrio velox DSM 12556]
MEVFLPLFFDSHCHWNDGSIDAQEVLRQAERCVEASVGAVLVAGYDVESSVRGAELARKGVGAVSVLASAGLHPHDASQWGRGVMEDLVGLLEMPHVRALGEIGLDFWYYNSPRDRQLECFEAQLQLAEDLKKPVILHIRDGKEPEDRAFPLAFDVLRGFAGSGDVKGVLHCFSGGVAEARRGLDLGFMISFAGPLTYPKSEESRRVCSYVPSDMLLLETDSPYLAPRSRRGKRNEPAYVVEVYHEAAKVRGVDVDTLGRLVWSNGERLFGPIPKGVSGAVGGGEAREL